MNAAIDLHTLIPAWQALQSAAPLAHIENDADYEQATTLLNSLLDAVRDDSSHPLYSLVSVVGDLIEAYEIDHDPRLAKQA
ncbi:MAG: transcriptional regulator, XRE family protein [Gammaproteobacteria bacterium]